MESREESEEDKEVVDAEEALEEVGREPDERRTAPAQNKHAGIKCQGKHDPNEAPEESLREGNGRIATEEKEKIQRQHHSDEQVEADPEQGPRFRRHAVHEVGLVQGKHQTTHV